MNRAVIVAALLGGLAGFSASRLISSGTVSDSLERRKSSAVAERARAEELMQTRAALERTKAECARRSEPASPNGAAGGANPDNVQRELTACQAALASAADPNANRVTGQQARALLLLIDKHEREQVESVITAEARFRNEELEKRTAKVAASANRALLEAAGIAEGEVERVATALCGPRKLLKPIEAAVAKYERPANVVLQELEKRRKKSVEELAALLGTARAAALAESGVEHALNCDN